MHWCTRRVFDLKSRVKKNELKFIQDRYALLTFFLIDIPKIFYWEFVVKLKDSGFRIAGGRLRAMSGIDGFGSEITSMMTPIEPLNFVERISSRPLLFINAEDDEVIPKPMAILLHAIADEPKKVIWNESKHHVNLTNLNTQKRVENVNGNNIQRSS